MYAVTINKIITNIHLYKMYQCSECVFTDVLMSLKATIDASRRLPTWNPYR